jgi:hypothetical protein
MEFLVLGIRFKSLSETMIFDIGSWWPVSAVGTVTLRVPRKDLDFDVDIIVQLLCSST